MLATQWFSAGRHLLVLPLLTLLTWGCVVEAESAWELVHKQSASAAGSSLQPSIRYGHASDRHGSKMLMSLGYYYDREANAATWMSDTWELDMQPPHAWRRLVAGISQDQAHQAYSSARAPHAPSGRFGHSSAVHNDTLYVFGGHDGGISRHGRQNYEPGYDFDELWAFSTQRRSWRLVASSELQRKQGGPGKRYLHAAAVVGDQLLVYGGLAEGQGDVWAFDLVHETWAQLAGEAPRADGGPGRRVGHSMTPVDQPGGNGGRVTGFVVLGGRYVEADGTALDGDAFFFDLASRAWRRLPVATASAPSGRKYHAEASAWVRAAPDGALLRGGAAAAAAAEAAPYVHLTVVFGGTVTTPGLSCSAEAWLLTLDCGATAASWQRLPDLGTALYDARGAASADGAVFGFGGHLCSDSRGALPFYYVNTVSKLDLVEAGVRVGAGACRVAAEQLPRQRGQGEKGMEKEL